MPSIGLFMRKTPKVGIPDARASVYEWPSGIRWHFEADALRSTGQWVKDSLVDDRQQRQMAHGYDSLMEMPRDFSVDEELRDRLQGFDAFLREQHPPLLKFLRLRTGEEDARDIAQESLTRLLRYRDSEPAEAWRPLLYRIARNLLNEQYRRSQSHRDKHNVQVETIELADPAPPLDVTIQRAQEQAWLREAMLSLPPRCRQVFVLVRIDGLSQGEVARRCGISVKTVEKHLATALAALCDKAGVWESGAST